MAPRVASGIDTLVNPEEILKSNEVLDEEISWNPPEHIAKIKYLRVNSPSVFVQGGFTCVAIINTSLKMGEILLQRGISISYLY